MTIPFGFAVLEAFSKPQELLAIAGGAAVGALGTGLLAQLLSRWLTTKKLPHFPTMTARGVGGAVVGLLTAMWVWQGGTWGPGGPGGPGSPGAPSVGDSKPDDNAKDKTSPETPKVADKATVDEGPPVPTESVLRIKVLTDEALSALAGDPAVQAHRFYVLESDKEAKDPLTLDDVQKRIEARMAASPALLQLNVMLPPGNTNIGRVYNLLELAKKKKGLKVKTESPPE
jgi:hypothetical protein